MKSNFANSSENENKLLSLRFNIIVMVSINIIAVAANGGDPKAKKVCPEWMKGNCNKCAQCKLRHPSDCGFFCERIVF